MRKLIWTLLSNPCQHSLSALNNLLHVFLLWTIILDCYKKEHTWAILAMTAAVRSLSPTCWGETLFLAKFIIGNDFVRWLSKSCVRGAFAKGFLQLYFYIFSATDIIWLSALCPWYVLFICLSCCQLEWKDFDVYLKYKYTWLACLPEPPALPLVVRPAENEYYFREELITTIFSKII